MCCHLPTLVSPLAARSALVGLWRDLVPGSLTLSPSEDHPPAGSLKYFKENHTSLSLIAGKLMIDRKKHNPILTSLALND